MKKRLNFKDAAGRTVFVSVELENGKLSMSGSVAGHHGQCQDEIKPANEDQRRLIEIWKDWHLNDLHAGTQKQEKALKDAGFVGQNYDYAQASEYLKTISPDGKPLGFIAIAIKEGIADASKVIKDISEAIEEVKGVYKMARTGQRRWRAYKAPYLKDQREFLSIADLPKISKRLKDLEEEKKNYQKAIGELGEKWLYSDNGHRYGHAWLTWPLPDGLEAELSDICERIGEYKEPEFTGSYTFDVPGIGKIEASVKHVGAEIKWGHTKQKHRVKVGSASFDYWSPDKIDSVQDLAQAVHCFFSDALAYAQADGIDDFMSNFGYEKDSEALKAYNACKSTFENAQNMGYGESEICDILNYLSEEWEC